MLCGRRITRCRPAPALLSGGMAPTLLQALQTWNDAEARRRQLEWELATAVARNDRRAADEVMFELRDAEVFAGEMRLTMLRVLLNGNTADGARAAPSRRLDES